MSVQQGKRVIVWMRNGTRFVAKFKGHKSRYIEFYDHPNVAKSAVVTLSFAKGDVRQPESL
jgi:hypothetical protein